MQTKLVSSRMIMFSRWACSGPRHCSESSLEQINGINVISTPHEECVQLIKRAGDTLALKVITANTSSISQSQSHHSDCPSTVSATCSQSLPYRRKGTSIMSNEIAFDPLMFSSTSSWSRTTIIQRFVIPCLLPTLSRLRLPLLLLLLLLLTGTFV